MLFIYTTGTHALPDIAICTRPWACGSWACVYILGKALVPVDIIIVAQLEATD